MKISGKSIRNINRVMKVAGDLKEIRLAYCLDDQDSSVWERLGFSKDLVVGHYLIPSAVGKFTAFNAQGKEIVCKDLPKQPETIMYFGTTRDWHGGIHSGIKTRTIPKYPREFLSAPSESFYVTEISGTIYLTSSVLNLVPEEETRNVHLCNMMLECFGEFEIFNSNTGAIVGPKLKRVQWEILPKGEYPWSRSKEIIQSVTSHMEKKDKEVIEHRMKIISNYKPDFLATGHGGFNGYFVYGFERKGLYILESVHLDNATYVFTENWEVFSQLTKSEIINDDIAHARLVHDNKWAQSLREVLSGVKI